MKNNVIIRMSAGHHTVTVKSASGEPIVFDRNKMTKEENRVFHREFMNAFRNNRKTT